MTRYRVFYEDQAAGEIKEFGPHLLLCACVADRVESRTLWQVRDLVDGQPKKGDSKLLAACKRHAERDLDEVVFALFDADKLHIRLGIPKRSLDDLRAALAAEIHSPKVVPFLLEDNLESMVHATAKCFESPIESPIAKRHNQRDKLLARAARGSRAVRECILTAVPSFAALVEAVAAAVAQMR